MSLCICAVSPEPSFCQWGGEGVLSIYIYIYIFFFFLSSNFFYSLHRGLTSIMPSCHGNCIISKWGPKFTRRIQFFQGGGGGGVQLLTSINILHW